MNSILDISDLGQSFNGTKVLDGVTFSLEKGNRLAVLGASGSGKTTLLRLIAGLEAPQAGTITIAGREASRAGSVLIAPERRETALVFQGLALFPHLNALDQIAFAAEGRGGKKLATELLKQIGLGHRATARLDELSGGERQRIALARALAQGPRLLLMDEPFASLDDEKRAEMRDLLRSLLETRETTLILVTHSRDDALDLAQDVLVLDSGRPAIYDRLENTLTRPRRAAAVRSLGLGQIVDGEITAEGEVRTALGKVAASTGRRTGSVKILIRPGQARIASEEEGVEAEVISIELRPPELREVRRVAVLWAAGMTIRLLARDCPLGVGKKTRVVIEGECEVLED